MADTPPAMQCGKLFPYRIDMHSIYKVSVCTNFSKAGVNEKLDSLTTYYAEPRHEKSPFEHGHQKLFGESQPALWNQCGALVLIPKLYRIIVS